MRAASTLALRWQAPLQSPSYLRGDSPPRVFRLDVNGDGREEVCAQLGRTFVALSGGGVAAERGEAFVAPLPPGPNGEVRWVEAEERGDLSLRENGREIWTRPLGRRRFSLIGGHLDYEGEWSHSPYRGVGPYVQEHRVVHLTTVHPSPRGEPVVLVILADGRALLFDLNGALRRSLVLLRGSFSDAMTLAPAPDAPDAAGQYVVQAQCTYRQRLRFWRRGVHEAFVMLLEGDRVIDKRWKNPLSHRIPGQPGRYVTVSGDDILEWQGRRIRPAGTRRSEPSRRWVVRDVEDPAAGLEFTEDRRRGEALAVRLPNGDELWTVPWPHGAERVSDVVGSLSRVDGVQYVALLVEFQRHLAQYDTDVAFRQALVLRIDGTILAREEFDGQSTVKVDSRCLPVVVDLDGRGHPQLVIATHEMLFAWDFSRRPDAGGQALAEPSAWDTDTPPLPPEDLWSIDLVGSVPGGEA